MFLHAYVIKMRLKAQQNFDLKLDLFEPSGGHYTFLAMVSNVNFSSTQTSMVESRK